MYRLATKGPDPIDVDRRVLRAIDAVLEHVDTFSRTDVYDRLQEAAKVSRTPADIADGDLRKQLDRLCVNGILANRAGEYRIAPQREGEGLSPEWFRAGDQRVLQVLDRGDATSGQIASELGWTGAATRTRMHRMREAGMVREARRVPGSIEIVWTTRSSEDVAPTSTGVGAPVGPPDAPAAAGPVPPSPSKAPPGSGGVAATPADQEAAPGPPTALVDFTAHGMIMRAVRVTPTKGGFRLITADGRWVADVGAYFVITPHKPREIQ